MENKKSFCTKCLKEVDADTEKCECGGHNFAFGDLKVEDGRIVCKCGSSNFKCGMHMDYSNKATTTLVCAKCGNVCGKEYYRTAEDMMYWEDDDFEDDAEE